MQSLEENGFVNYYGMQRFGNFFEDDPAITPLIGYFMIRNDPVSACLSFTFSFCVLI